MTIDASDGQGMQIGSGNTQYNNFGPKAPLDPVALSALSPHVAIARLRSRSHDELVDFFAAASRDVVGEILAAFLAADEATVVAILGDINRRKATELTGVLAESEPWLAQLPQAAEAIAAKAAMLRWAPARGLERVEGRRILGKIHGEGYVREYRDGRVYWSETRGAWAVSGAIKAYAARSWAGFPAGDQENATPSPSGTTGIRQLFEHGMVYSSERGTCIVASASMQYHEDKGGSGGWLGFPIAERQGRFDRVQSFEGGMIFDSPLDDPLAVRSVVVAALPDGNFVPISEEGVLRFRSGALGYVQRFTGPRGVTGRDLAVYSSDKHGAVAVSPQIWAYYRDLGAHASWLGFPAKPAKEEDGLGYQSFEGGFVYWQSKTGPLAVRREVDTRRWQEKLGYPTTEEQSLGVDVTDRIQFFDYGLVTRRDGNYEVWRHVQRKPS